MKTPLILYIPGLMPKPDAGQHREALYRSLLHGLRNVDADTADMIDADPRAFDIVSWTYDFYGEYRDLDIDAASIDAMLEHDMAPEDAIREACSPSRRFLRLLYLMGDWFPVLIPWLANERVEIHIRDLQRYAKDENGVASQVRDMLKLPLLAAWRSERPTLLIAHSMGSVIAWDCLWQLSHEERDPFRLDTFMTMGSPLGQRFIQRHILGHDRAGQARYPHNIRHWLNLSAQGDLTAVDPKLSDDFGRMLRDGLVETLEDQQIFNWFRLDGELNVHAEYGYLANPVTARYVADWWRSRAG